MDIEINMPHVVPDDSDDDEGDDPSDKNERSQLKFTDKGGGGYRSRDDCKQQGGPQLVRCGPAT